MNITWIATWTYRGSVNEASKVNGSFWFQLVIFFSAIGLWTVHIVLSTIKKSAPSIQTSSNKELCKKQLLFNDNWLSECRVIVTRTTASLFITIATAELLIFNAIANYSGKGSVNASSAVMILFAGLMFYFFSMMHKHEKKSENAPAQNGLYGIVSFFILFMATGVFVWFLAYTDAFSNKTTKGGTELFLIGAIMFIIGMFLLCVSPLKGISNEKAYNRTMSLDTGTLVTSGEFYSAFSIFDCFVIWNTLAIFIFLEAYFIGRVMTAQYAVPFIFLQIIPIYGFVLNLAMLFRAGAKTLYVSIAYNAVFFVIMSVSITNSMLHVCAIPGVNTACASYISHTTTNTNVLVCGPYVLLLFLISIGLINASCVPALLLKSECARL